MSLSHTLRRGLLPALNRRILPVAALASTPLLTSSFSTSSPAFAQPAKAKGKPSTTLKRKTNYSQKKKKVETNTRRSPFAPGERRAIRNRIILSNTNAPSVELPDLTNATLTPSLPSATMYGLPAGSIDQLRALEAFRRTQAWRYFQRPATVIRENTKDLATRMLAVEKGAADVNARFILDGAGGAGKSILLLQALNWAVQRNWLVINIPNAQDLTIGHTEYEFDTESGLWAQREYCQALLKRTALGNAKLLLQTKLSQDYRINRMDYPKSLTLHRFCELGARDPFVAYEIFNIFMNEINRESFKAPILFALDNFTHLMRPSGYKDPNFKTIHSLDLALPALFMQYLRGEKKFGKGLIVAATSSQAPRAPEWDIAKLGDKAKWPVYTKLDRAKIEPAVKGVEVVPVKGLNTEEGRALLNYCKASGLMSEVAEVTDAVVTERMTLAAGLPKELVAGAVRIRC